MNEMEQLRRRAESWLDDSFNTTLLRDEALEGLNRWLRDPTADPMGGVVIGHLARWEAYSGLVDVLHGAEDGWRTLTRSFYHHVWRLQLVLAHRDGTSKGNAERILIGGLLTAWATWWEADGTALSFARRLNDRGVFFSAGPDFELTERFLQSLTLHGAHVDRRPKQEPYSALLRYLHDGGPLPQAAFDDACDLHVSEALDEYHGAFRWTPWDLLPVELLAYCRICENHAKEPPEQRHPIVRTPVCVRRRVIEPPDELRQLSEAVRAACDALRHGDVASEEPQG